MKSAIKTFLVVVAVATTTHIAIAQTPYDDFAPSKKKKEMLKLPEATFTAYNEDTASLVKYVELDKETLTLKYFGKDSLLIAQTQLQPNDFKWLSVDPLAYKYPNYSPYASFANNPVYYIDPDGRKFVNFDANGNYTGTTKDNWFHNTFFGTRGRILDANGNATQKFRFADPTNDVKDIQNGTITKLVFVTEKDVRLMVARAGGFDHENKTENRGLNYYDRYGYIAKEGTGGGKMDFSYSQIPLLYPDASKTPLDPQTLSPLIFLVGDVAHNQMNFGNFIFGATGQAMGFFQLELLAGAHKNSRFPEDASGKRIPDGQVGPNGYQPSWDSADDQFSIKQGFKFGNQQGYDKKEYKVEAGPLSPGTVIK
jgi:hypothetical protein